LHLIHYLHAGHVHNVKQSENKFLDSDLNLVPPKNLICCFLSQGPPSQNFHKNSSITFKVILVILLTDKPTDKQTEAET